MSEPEIIEVEECATAAIHGVVSMADIVTFFDGAFTELATVLGRQGAVPTGPAFARYAGPPGDTVDLEVGFPVTEPLATDGRVRASSLPGGRVARLVHAGGYDRLGESWDRLRSWILERDLAPGAAFWEVDVTEPNPEMDPADLRTELVWTLG